MDNSKQDGKKQTNMHFCLPLVQSRKYKRIIGPFMYSRQKLFHIRKFLLATLMADHSNRTCPCQVGRLETNMPS